MIIHFFYRLSKGILVITLVLMVFSILIQIISRNIFSYSFIWADELAKYCLVWSSFIGASMGLKDKELGAMDYLEHKLKAKFSKWHKVFLEGLVLLFLGFILYYSFILLFKPSVYLQISPVMQIPMYYVYMSLPISSFFMLIYSMHNMVQLIRKRVDGA